MKNDVIHILPIDHIHIINPRTRNQKIFAELVENISIVGLKRPITVTLAEKKNEHDQFYNLLCGQGRLEACQVLGEDTIPCRIVDANSDESYLISLVENIARRKHTSIELLVGIRMLSNRGYELTDIARKIGLEKSYIKGILHLLSEGEERLINAVEQGYLPITVAISIARVDDSNIQSYLSEIYEKGLVNQAGLNKIRNLLNRRKLIGKKAHGAPQVKSTEYSANKLMRIYKEEAQRQQIMIKQAEFDEQQLLVILSCLSKLFDNKYFQLLLKSENLTDMPKNLSQRLLQYSDCGG